MTTETNPLAKHGRVSYLEIPAQDPGRSASFYSHVFGWQVDQRTAEDYRFADGEGLMIGRWVTRRSPAREPGLLLFIYVNGIEEAIRRVTASGGEVIQAPYAEGDVRVARVRDPGGNVIGLWQFAT